MTHWPASLFWTYAIREGLRRPLRSLLTLLGIVLAVAAATGVPLASSGTRAAYTGMFQVAAGRARIELLPGSGDASFVPDLERLSHLPGVKAALPVVQATSGLLTPQGPVTVLALGIDPTRDPAARDLVLLDGDPIDSADGVWLVADFARRHGLELRQNARLMTAQGPVALPVRGLLANQGPASFNRGALVVLPLRLAQQLIARPGQVTAVQMVLAPDASPRDLTQKLADAYPTMQVRSPGDRGLLGGHFLVSIEGVMNTLVALALLAGTLVAFNAFLMQLSERRSTIALLRAVGATRAKVASLVLRQGLILGVLGTLLGLPLGMLLAALLLAVHESFLNVALPRLYFDPVSLLLGALSGPAMALSAAWIPSRWAAAQPPLPGPVALDPAPVQRVREPMLVGVGLLALVVIYLGALIGEHLDPVTAAPLAPVAAGLGLVAFSCLLSLLLPSLLRLIGWLMPRWLGIEGVLAVRQLLRRPARTALTFAALFVAVTASIDIGLSFLMNLRDIHTWYEGTIDVDYIVRAVVPDPGVVITPAVLPESALVEIRSLPGCQATSRIRFVPARLGRIDALVFVRDFPRSGPLPLVLEEGNLQEVEQGLARGGAVLGVALAQRLHLRPGDRFPIPGRTGPHLVEVVGLVKEYAVGGMVVYLDWQASESWLGSATPHGVLVQGSSDVGPALTTYCHRHGLILQANRDFASAIHHVVICVRWFLAGMIGLILLVALVGIVNTLTTNVLEQSRELGVLRALGMQRGQVQKLVVAQATILAWLGGVIGLPIGLLLAYLMNRATPGLLGHRVPFHITWWYVAVCLVGTSAIAVAAGLLPARRAARLEVIQAIREE